MDKQWKHKDTYTRKTPSGRRSRVQPHRQRYILTTKAEEFQPKPQIHLGNCGVFGIYSQTGINRFHIDLFVEMLEYNKQRGSQATGVIIGPKPGRKTQIGLKTPGDPTLFLNKYRSTLYAKAPGSQFLVGHGRRATRGNPQDNRNNHPLRGNNFWLVHNGVVSVNDDESGNPYVLVDNEKTDSFILVDTLNKALQKYDDKYKAVIESYKWHRGGATIAVGFDDGDLIIVTRTNPMLYIRDVDVFYFAQQPDIFPKSMQVIKVPNGHIMQIQKGDENFLRLKDDNLPESAMHKLGANWRTLSKTYQWEDEIDNQPKKPKKKKTPIRKQTKLKKVIKPSKIKRKPSPIIHPKTGKETLMLRLEISRRKNKMKLSQIKEYFELLPNKFQVRMINKVTTSEDDFELLQWIKRANNMDDASARNLIVLIDSLLVTTG